MSSLTAFSLKSFIEQLEQVKNAFFETTGLVSVWCYSKQEIMPGLGIHPDQHFPEPELLSAGSQHLQEGYHSYRNCGFTQYFPMQQSLKPCPKCEATEWSNQPNPFSLK